MVSYQVVEGVSRVALEGEMTIYTAGEIKPPLWESVGAANEVEVDLSQVSELDTAGLQLLMLLKKRAPKGTRISFVNHSQTVVDVIEMMDLAAYFNDPIVLAGESDSVRGG